MIQTIESNFNDFQTRGEKKGVKSFIRKKLILRQKN